MDLKQAEALIGKRIEIPVHYDHWMQGAKYGLVKQLTSNSAGRFFFVVQMDNTNAGKVYVWQDSWDYIKVI